MCSKVRHINQRDRDTGATRAIKGTGLGLSISRQLVEMMGGSITVVSVLGEGAAFTVTIPKVMVGVVSGKFLLKIDSR